MSDNHAILIQLQADLTEPNRLDKTAIENAALKTLTTVGIEHESMVSIIIGTNEQIQELNQKYRGVDAPTDVLSFPSDPLPPEVDEDQGYLGDIIIGLPYLVQRAKEEKRRVHDDLMLMVVHGMLHLLGYDHDTPEHQTEMWAIQADILKSLDIDLRVPDYIHD